MLELSRLTERVWVYPCENDRDRPNLVYIRGDNWSLACDAGHSGDHIAEFYQALEAECLPLPELTVLTHWHWDHTFAMHKVHGLCIANALSYQHLADFRNKLAEEGTDFFFALDISIRREYADGKPVIVTLPDIVFKGELMLDAGNCSIRLFQAGSPHTDDSTLIEISDERVLVLGDSVYGTFPEWNMDPVKAADLADTIRKIDPAICIPGHDYPAPPDLVIKEFLTGE